MRQSDDARAICQAIKEAGKLIADAIREGRRPQCFSIPEDRTNRKIERPEPMGTVPGNGPRFLRDDD